MRGSVIRQPKACTTGCHHCSYQCISSPYPFPTVSEALKLWFSQLSLPDLPTERLPLFQARGRITAEPIFSPLSIPTAECSSHDGIAISYDQCQKRMKDGRCILNPGEFLLCPTGTAIPSQFDTVAYAEECQLFEDGSAVLLHLPDRYQCLQLPGSRLKQGQQIMTAKQVLTPSSLALLQYAGLTQVAVLAKPQVGIIPVGDDLLPPGGWPCPGQFIDCNSLYLQTMAEQYGGIGLVYPIVPDKDDEIASAIQAALPDCDLLVIIGGVSKGELNYHDHTVGVIRRMGEIICHGVRLTPGGKHLLLGKLQNIPIIGMPGPPHAALIMTEYFLPPVLKRMLGCPASDTPTVYAVLEHDLLPRGTEKDIREYRVILTPTDNGYTARSVQPMGESPENFVYASGTIALTGNPTDFLAGCTVPVRLLRSEGEIKMACIDSSDSIRQESSSGICSSL